MTGVLRGFGQQGRLINTSKKGVAFVKTKKEKKKKITRTGDRRQILIGRYDSERQRKIR